MSHYLLKKTVIGTAFAVLGVGPGVSQADVIELGEGFVRIEINAADGDAGFHAKMDGDAWRSMQILRPGDHKSIFKARARRNLRKQGLTEIFFESAEPPCTQDPLWKFIGRWPAGEYEFVGITNDGQSLLAGSAELSYALPAAPDLSELDGAELELDDDEPFVIAWGPGTDLGNCHDQSLIDDGVIADPAAVPVHQWEVTVEPEVEEEDLEAAGLPLSVYNVLLPVGQTSVSVPYEYMAPYVEAGILEFKVAVGAKNLETQNQTYSEVLFTVEEDD